MNKVGADGERKGYLPEDLEGPVGVTELLRRERATGSGDLDATLARNILRAGATYKGGELAGGDSLGRDEDDEGAVDAVARAMTSRDERLTAHERQKRDMQRAAASQRRADSATARCALCMDAPDFRKHLVISLGDHSVLMVPPDGERVPGHLVIAPLAHVASTVAAEEDAYAEVNRFKAALHSFYAARGEDVIFLESCLVSAGGPGAGRQHARVDVIPMDKDVAFDAPL